MTKRRTVESGPCVSLYSITMQNSTPEGARRDVWGRYWMRCSIEVYHEALLSHESTDNCLAAAHPHHALCLT